MGKNVQALKNGETITIIDPSGKEYDITYEDEKYVISEESERKTKRGEKNE